MVVLKIILKKIKKYIILIHFLTKKHIEKQSLLHSQTPP
jgi:hypothetical protein